jgi:hypothetical protein
MLQHPSAQAHNPAALHQPPTPCAHLQQQPPTEMDAVAQRLREGFCQLLQEVLLGCLELLG